MTEKTTEQISPALPAALASLAELWERMADHDEASVGHFEGPTAATLDIEVAERGSTYRKAATDVREVLRTGRVPHDLVRGEHASAASAGRIEVERLSADCGRKDREFSTCERLLREAYDETARLHAAAESHRLAVSEALGLGTGAPWDAIRDRAAELCRLTDDAQQAGEIFSAAPSAPADRDLRDRIVHALDECRSLIPTAQADAVLAVLPARTDRGAELREAEAEAERQLATVQRVRRVLESELVLNRTALEYRALLVAALMADEAQQAGGGA